MARFRELNARRKGEFEGASPSSRLGDPGLARLLDRCRLGRRDARVKALRLPSSCATTLGDGRGEVIEAAV